MMNIKNISSIFVLYCLIIIVILYLLLKYIIIPLVTNKNNKLLNKKSIISTNFVDVNKPIYSNEDYKKNITCNYIPSPSKNR